MMQPYATPFYFVILAVVLLPLIIALLRGRKWMPYQVLVSGLMLWLTFGGTQSIWALLGFGVFETALIKAYCHYRNHLEKNSSLIFTVAVLLSIAPLIIVKITPLATPEQPFSIIGFLGISYLTFKTVSTLLEIRDGLIKEVPIKEFLYFLYFYPTISSGPIDRFRRFRKESEAPVTENYLAYLNKGIFYLFLGLLYNFIIAYLIANHFLNSVASQAILNPTLPTMLGSMYGYGLYLFFDFAGYSLFAIGVSYVMGYEIPHNFKRPFIAENINDFWQRWHMSLSFWFRDFVFMRFVKWIMVHKWSKNMTRISHIGFLVNMGLMGFWHGLTWYYILYGFYHGFLMVAYDIWTRFKKKHKWKAKTKTTKWLARGFAIFLTFNLVFVGFLIFSGIPDLAIRHVLHLPIKLPNY